MIDWSVVVDYSVLPILFFVGCLLVPLFWHLERVAAREEASNDS